MRQALSKGQVGVISADIGKRESLRTTMVIGKFLENLHRIPVNEIEKLTDKYGV